MMTGPHNPLEIPANLPVPFDDGAAFHLLGMALAEVELESTAGGTVRLGDAAAIGSRAVLFFYPRTGVPGQPPSPGFAGETWESIPGARGCTPQSCGFRDLHEEFTRLGARVWGISTNTPEHQSAFKARNRVPFEFLSDHRLRLVKAMRLPTFEFPVESGGPTTLARRMAWYVEVDHAGIPRLRKVWYPVFPPDRNAATVLAWLSRRAGIGIESIGDASAGFMRQELMKHWGETAIYSRDLRYEADRLPGFVARMGGVYRGQVTLAFTEHGAPAGECEVVTLSAGSDGQGIGERLLEAAEDAARARKCSRIFLTTTNDNLRALGFYQRRGWRLVAVLRGMIDRYRERQKHIPRISPGGVPIRDEIELELRLE